MTEEEEEEGRARRTRHTVISRHQTPARSFASRPGGTSASAVARDDGYVLPRGEGNTPDLSRNVMQCNAMQCNAM